MNTKTILNSRTSTEIVLLLSKILPPSIGYRLARYIAKRFLVHTNTESYLALKANQWVVSGGKLSQQELDQLTTQTVQNTANCLYDYYHNIRKPKSTMNMVDFSPNFQEYLSRIETGKEGILFVAPHLSNFDLSMRAAAMSGLNIQALSYPEPPSGYRIQNKIRREVGIDATPISASSTHQAFERLRNGGAVMTGVDRPYEYAKHKPLFFGRPALLSDFHVRIALRVNIPVIVIAAKNLPGHRYIIQASEPIPMKKFNDREKEHIYNLEAVLEVVADYVKQAPSEWSMFYPVWPEALTEIPM